MRNKQLKFSRSFFKKPILIRVRNGTVSLYIFFILETKSVLSFTGTTSFKFSVDTLCAKIYYNINVTFFQQTALEFSQIFPVAVVLTVFNKPLWEIQTGGIKSRESYK